MIVQIRGTSGSGKSTIVRSYVEQATRVQKYTRAGRKQPIGYVLEGGLLSSASIAVPGHYETACGGCDTLPSYDDAFGLIRAGAGLADHVLFEGLLVSEEVKRTVQLHRDFPGQLRVIFLNTPVDICLESIRARRAARGDERPLKEDNTRNRVKTIVRACHLLQEAGVDVWETNYRDDAVDRVQEYLS